MAGAIPAATRAYHPSRGSWGAFFNGGSADALGSKSSREAPRPLLRVAAALDVEHLEDLEAERLAVLEEQRDLLSHRHAAFALVGDDGAAVFGTQSLVDLEVDEVFAEQRPHSAPSP